MSQFTNISTVKHEPDTINMFVGNTSVKHRPSHNAIVYWDHDNVSIPHDCSVEHIISSLKNRIYDTIGSQVIYFRVYTSSRSLHPTVQKSLRLRGVNVEHTHASPNTSSKCMSRISADIALKLVELEQNKQSKCIAVVSNDDACAHLFSKIHKQAVVSHLLYITFGQINPFLTDNVDFVIQCMLNPTHNNDETISLNISGIDNNETTSLIISRDQPISKIMTHLKQRVPSLTPHRIKLFCDGVYLSGLSKTVGVFQLCDGDTIEWSVHMVSVYLHIQKGNRKVKSVTLHLPQNDQFSILQIKKWIKTTQYSDSDVSIRDMSLYYFDIELDDNQCLLTKGLDGFQNDDPLTLKNAKGSVADLSQTTRSKYQMKRQKKRRKNCAIKYSDYKYRMKAPNNGGKNEAVQENETKLRNKPSDQQRMRSDLFGDVDLSVNPFMW
eukprot:980016_1